VQPLEVTLSGLFVTAYCWAALATLPLDLQEF